MKIEVSNGELLDKYTILDIKLSNIEDETKLNNIRKEFETLTPKVEKVFANCSDVGLLNGYYNDLLNINKTLWNIEDQIRECESIEAFGPDFVELARAVYYNNDERADVKYKINQLTDSSLVEEKSYVAY